MEAMSASMFEDNLSALNYFLMAGLNPVGTASKNLMIQNQVFLFRKYINLEQIK